MRRSKHRISAFSLSFLDIMACGFGAVTLLFLILKHDVTSLESADPLLNAEVNLLQEDLRVGEEALVELRNSLARVDESLVEAQGLSARVVADIEKTRRELSAQADPEQQIEILRKQVETLERETANLQEQGNADNVRQFIGDGERQYLTGLKLGGKQILILVDASASMLSDSIVNVIRRRNMSDSVKRNSEKWQRAIRTTEWLVAQLPQDSRYQIYVFNTAAEAVAGDDRRWRDTADRQGLDSAIKKLTQVVPAGGSSLINAFLAINSFDTPPDNLFLITDGLPTQGRKPSGFKTITGRDRLKLFAEATQMLPRRLPVNILLFPMEGDPMAAASFWQLALSSQGSFMSPSRDWP
ncbi:vWA domain-containing protein [Porticoccus hydrocarbonoclasticus]|uniref:VWA domain-containing protein n=1 Tax=Porticoccus hydrocarbonoclasticus TaxID=1073414 RepID=UPI00055B779D|nr:VWA domain-containing protein [Porticoccus hydrocarbonoclasticus]